MALASILLAVLSFGCMAVGVVTSLVPHVGTVFSFAAPALALLGVTLGGVQLSRNKRTGERTDVARAGVILSVIAFIPGMLTALTCGVCNAVLSSGNVQMHRSTQWSVGPAGQLVVVGPDAGVFAPPPVPAPPAGPPGTGSAPGSTGKGVAPGGADGKGIPGAPPGALPPPPLPAGPSQPATGH